MSKEYNFKCNVCQSKKFAIILDFNKKPIVHHLKTKTSIKNKSYDFSIATCKDCSHLQIYKNINPKILYKNYLTPSAWKNNWHIDLLLKKMVSIFNLNKNDKILEIGSNDGYFIDRFLKNNFKNIYGIEPSKDVFIISKDKGHKVINDFFSHNIIKKKTNSNIKFDLIFFRHVLEHVSNLKSFFSQINQSLKGSGNLMIEVPDHDMNYENYDYTFWEEHTNYFNKDILKFLLYKNNFRIIHHETSLYSGKAIMLFCEKHNNIKKNFTFNSNKKKINDFQNKFNTFKKLLKEFLKNFNQDIYIYGCGNRSCNFVNLLGIKDYLSGFIDDNIEKQNKYVPGSNLKIYKPGAVNLNKSIILLGVNTENENKIITKLKNKNNVFSILPPSKYLPVFWKNLIDKKSEI